MSYNYTSGEGTNGKNKDFLPFLTTFYGPDLFNKTFLMNEYQNPGLLNYKFFKAETAKLLNFIGKGFKVKDSELPLNASKLIERVKFLGGKTDINKFLKEVYRDLKHFQSMIVRFYFNSNSGKQTHSRVAAEFAENELLPNLEVEILRAANCFKLDRSQGLFSPQNFNNFYTQDTGSLLFLFIIILSMSGKGFNRERIIKSLNNYQTSD